MLPFRLFSKEGIKPVSTEAWSFQYLLQKLKKTLWFPWDYFSHFSSLQTLVKPGRSTLHMFFWAASV